MPPKPLSFGTLLGDRQLGFWGASTRLPEESPSPYVVVFFPIAADVFFFLEEETPSSPTACPGTLLELRNRGWEGMIVSSPFCFTFYMFQQFISLFHMFSHVIS